MNCRTQLADEQLGPGQVRIQELGGAVQLVGIFGSLVCVWIDASLTQTAARDPGKTVCSPRRQMNLFEVALKMKFLQGSTVGQKFVSLFFHAHCHHISSSRQLTLVVPRLDQRNCRVCSVDRPWGIIVVPRHLTNIPAPDPPHSVKINRKPGWSGQNMTMHF